MPSRKELEPWSIVSAFTASVQGFIEECQVQLSPKCTVSTLEGFKGRKIATESELRCRIHKPPFRFKPQSICTLICWVLSGQLNTLINKPPTLTPSPSAGPGAPIHTALAAGVCTDPGCPGSSMPQVTAISSPADKTWGCSSQTLMHTKRQHSPAQAVFSW